MFKRFIFSAFIALFAVIPAHAAQIVNVDYVHKIIDRKMTALGATKSMKINATDIYAAANMKYLLTAVDVANEMLNGGALTSYGTTTYATTVAADTVVANTAAETLIQKYPSWSFTTTDDTTSFSFKISAKGNFLIDWGDGKTTLAKRTSTGSSTYSHTYSSA
ncbi:hypothetical protein HDR66_03350, partial [bacterium]|nr:hypothetical protein [bacterium]